MLSLWHCRKLLQNPDGIQDSDLEQIRDQFYAIANLALESITVNSKNNLNFDVESEFNLLHNDSESAKSLSVAKYSQALSLINESDQEIIEERAAILEFEAGFKRSEAERLALAEYCRRSQNNE